MGGDSKAGGMSAQNSGQGTPEAAGIRPSTWKPSSSNFRSYNVLQAEKRAQPRKGLHVVVCRPIVARLTRYIVETYQLCNSSFTYSDIFNPKRYLTNPSTGVSNNGSDNTNSDLILSVNGVLVNELSNSRYVVKEMLGQGTFGQVVKCWADEQGSYVAVKVIKNQIAYYRQALVEISILTMLNHKFDPDDRHHIVRILDSFLFQGHLCIAFELLSFNLFELIKGNRYRGISLHLLRLFTKQILDSLGVLRDASVIHCDLKPENILLTASLQSGEIKLIDFGSACLENRTVYAYIQSRFYRSPEVLLGHPYTTAIDMWSLGCVAAELFLGLPLFPGESEYDLLHRMIDTLGCQPPDHLLRNSKNTSKYFRNVSAAPPLDGVLSGYRFLTEKEYEVREKKKPAIGKMYFKRTRLEDIIYEYPFRSSLTPEEKEAENAVRVAFVDFLKGLVQFDPVKRWTPHQAAQHPFITGEPFTGAFTPVPETPRTPVCRGWAVEHHNPGAGHWFGAGLSPQVAHTNVGLHYSSPQYHGGPFSFASSYGSYGSYTSCDGFGLGSSYGSHSDVTNMYYPTPPGGPQLGYDTWRKVSAVPAGYGPLGISPSNSVLKPMSLGGSPSQYTPPGSQFPSPSSPQSSPGRYGPTSPSRFGKAAGVGHHNQRRGFCPPMNPNAGVVLSHDGMMGQRQHVQPSSASGFEGHNTHLEGGTYLSASRPHGQVHLKQRGSGLHAKPSIYKAGSLAAYLSTSETITESPECASAHPDPGDWDANYSLDLLLQEEASEPFPTASGPAGVMGSGGARLGPGPGGFSGVGPGHIGSTFPYLQGGSLKISRLSDPPQSSEGNPSVLQGPFHGTQAGTQHSYGRSSHHISPQHLSPSRLGQQSGTHQRQRVVQFQHPAEMPSSFPEYSNPASYISGYQYPPSTTEQIDRHLTGMIL